MEKNLKIARGAGQMLDKEAYKKKLNEICKELNALGPPVRDAKGWEKVCN